MKQTWRWFGPADLTSLSDMRQAGVQGVVTALHHVPSGQVWSPEEIEKRQRLVRSFADGTPTGLEWDVVESLVVSENIKKQTGAVKAHIADYCRSLEHLAAAGISTVCYNFMPVLDWTRTDLAWRTRTGGTAMRFDIVDFAAFDIHILKRAGAPDDIAPEIVAEAATRFASLDDKDCQRLTQNIVAGLPGANENLRLDDVAEHLAEYDNIDAQKLRGNLVDFLSDIMPTAERLGIRMCCHPDDPPFSLLGLPRIMSTADDFALVLDQVNSPSNGMTYCSGSLGARPDNDLVAIAKKFAAKIHFVHLRNVTRDNDQIVGSFFEDEHLATGSQIVDIVAVFLAEERRRAQAGRDDAQIPMRPDHGQDIIDDLSRSGQPGYPTIGRLKGLAELRGVMRAFEHPEHGLFTSA